MTRSSVSATATITVELLPTRLPGLILIRPKVFRDARGYFLEPYQVERYRAAGLTCDFVMDGESYSEPRVVRGLHYREPAEDKLVRCVRGRIWDVAVDIRPTSRTFGQWEGHELSEENQEQLFIPRGFAHGFSVLSQGSLMLYKKTEIYEGDKEKGILWSDPALAIDWKLEPARAIISERDGKNPSWRQWLDSLSLRQ